VACRAYLVWCLWCLFGVSGWVVLSVCMVSLQVCERWTCFSLCHTWFGMDDCIVYTAK